MVHPIGSDGFASHGSRLDTTSIEDLDLEIEIISVFPSQSPLQTRRVEPSPSLRVNNHVNLNRVDHGSRVGGKRSPLADILPVNQKKTNSNAVTPTACDGWKFPNGLYSRSYLPIEFMNRSTL
jgi:hypothetical protein